MNKKVWKYLALTVAILMATVSVSGCVNPIAIVNSYRTAAESDNFKLNENHVDVYRYHVAQNQLYYQYMYIQWGIMQDPTGGMVKNGAIDATQFINLMLPEIMGDDSFDASAYEYARQYLAYCEGAKEAGKYDELKEKTATDVDEYMEGLEKLAKSNNVSLSKYITKWIGKGLSKSDVRTAMEYYYIGIEFADYLFEQFTENVTTEQVHSYVDKNKANFYSSTVTSYKLANERMQEKIRDCKTADEVKTYLVDYYLEQKFEAQYKTNITDNKIADSDKNQTFADIRTTLLAMNDIGDADAVFTSNDTDAYKKACYTIANTINSTVKTQVIRVTASDQKWSDPTAATATDLVKWLFSDGRRVGDTSVLKSETKDKDGNVTSTTYTWYVLEDHLKMDTEKTKDMHYALVKDEQQAEAFWNALNAEKTPEKFARLVAEYAPGFSGEVNERLSFEKIKNANEALANWLYGEGRKEGDIFQTKNKDKDGNVTGYYIAYFVRENEETWVLTAREAIASEQLRAWYENAVVRYSVTVEYEFETTAAPNYSASNGQNDYYSYVVIQPGENGSVVEYKPSEGSGFITVNPSEGSIGSFFGKVEVVTGEVVTSESFFNSSFGSPFN